MLSATTGFAQDVTKIKFTLDWKIQGIHAWYYWAQEKGYFAAEKLDVTIDQGEGSAATVTRIMSGAYDAGFGDMNAIIQNAATKPADAPLMVYMIYNRAPFALLTKASSPVHSFKDLPGKKLGTPPGGASFKLLPLMAKKNNIDYAKIDVLNVAPNLQEQMLLQGQVDVIAIFTATSYMNLVSLGLDPDKDFRWIYYADSGVDLYSNGIMVSQKLAKEKPEAVKGLVRAINRAHQGGDRQSGRRDRAAGEEGGADQEGHREAPPALRLQDADRHARRRVRSASATSATSGWRERPRPSPNRSNCRACPSPPTCSAAPSCRRRPIACRRCCPIDRTRESPQSSGCGLSTCRVGADA